MREVEAQALLGLGRAGLADVRAEHLAQRPVDQVRGGVVARDRAAGHRRNDELGGLADEIELGGVEAQAGASLCR
jgi:hypothetical protein